MFSDQFLNGVADTWLGNLMRDVWFMWPLMENLHFFGLCAMFGALMVIDLRALGMARAIPAGPTLKLIPVAIAAFSINLVTGIAFYCGDPFRYTFNTAFLWKMSLILIAGFNALWFWVAEHKKLSTMGAGVDTDFQAKFIAGFSLILWVAVIILGRLIPYLE